jgi:hypothetical protein
MVRGQGKDLYVITTIDDAQKAPIGFCKPLDRPNAVIVVSRDIEI